MSVNAGAAPPAAVLDAPWHHRRVQRSRALVGTYLLTGSVLPPPPAAGGRAAKTPLKLPSLAAATKEPRSTLARLSFSEPALFSANESLSFEGLSRRPSVSQRRALLKPEHWLQSCSRPPYIHFSQAIQPISRPKPARRHSHNPALSSEVLHGDVRPSAPQHQDQPLTVVGKPCLLSCSQRPAARTQLHVFLPSEAEGEEADRESVDEGFMDELDSKITSLKLQQGAPKTATPHS